MASYYRNNDAQELTHQLSVVKDSKRTPTRKAEARDDVELSAEKTVNENGSVAPSQTRIYIPSHQL